MKEEEKREMRAAVERGMRWLDEALPQWRGMVSKTLLIMGDGPYGLFAQLFGTSHYGRYILPDCKKDDTYIESYIEREKYWGFRPQDSSRIEQWDFLAELWKEEL